MNQNTIYFAIFIFAIALGIIIRALVKLKQDIAAIQLSLDKIANQVGVVDVLIEDMSKKELNEKLKDLISRDKRIEAIKIYRLATGKNLEEAKNYIDNLV